MDNGPEVDDRPVVSGPGPWYRPRGRPLLLRSTGNLRTRPDACPRGLTWSTGPKTSPSGDKALVLPETDDGRLLFVLPWRGLALVGTADTPYEVDPDRVRPDGDDRVLGAASGPLSGPLPVLHRRPSPASAPWHGTEDSSPPPHGSTGS